MAIEGVKIAPHHQEFLDSHFGGVAPDWMAFHKKLTDPQFSTAVQEDTRSNDKLKAFSSAISMRDQHEGPSSRARSDVGGSYKVRYHPQEKRFSCSCPDWTYKKSVSGEDCKHITRMKSRTKENLVSKTKVAMMPPIETLLRVGNTMRRQEKDEQSAQRLKAQNQAFQEAFPQPGIVQAWLKHASIQASLALAAKNILGR